MHAEINFFSSCKCLSLALWGVDCVVFCLQSICTRVDSWASEESSGLLGDHLRGAFGVVLVYQVRISHAS